MKFKKGELVRVWTRHLYPEIDGVYVLSRVKRLSNYPYRIMRDGEEQLLERTEVFQIVYPLPAPPIKGSK